MVKTGLIWYRNDLRVNDHYGLCEARKNCDRLFAVYCFNPINFKNNKHGFKKTEKFRAQFLIETIKNLQKNLKELNIGLFIYADEPYKVIPSLVNKYEVKELFYQEEWTSEEFQETKFLKANLPSSIRYTSSYQQFLIEPSLIPYKDFNEIPEIFTKFRHKVEKDWLVSAASPKIKRFPKENFISTNTAVPTLQDLGLNSFTVDSRTAFPFKGGEEEANKRLQYYLWETNLIASYKETRNGLIGKDYSSKLSAWLANGSISAKTIYWEIKRYEKEQTKNNSTYWLIFELLWRDYFKYISLKHQSSIFQLKGISNKKLIWNRDSIVFKQWISGNTEEPFVNANMNEIANTGFMSNRGRQNVNSYWAKELKQDWRVGAAYFESLLIDYDVHSNWGNWMYNSGVGNDPRDRKFNITSQADRYDPESNYQKLWLSK